jgi:magnesium transporter
MGLPLRARWGEDARNAMAKRRSKSKSIGVSPGTLTGQPSAHPGHLHVLAYGLDGIAEPPSVRPEDIPELLRQYTTVWLDVDGNGDVQLLQALGQVLGLDRLALEDVLAPHQRPKEESYAGHLFLVLHMPTEEGVEQLCLFIGDNWVLSVQETPGDCFDGVRNRIRSGRERICGGGPDYLAYALIDSIIDSVLPPLVAAREHLEELEDEILEGLETEQLHAIHRSQRSLSRWRRSILPMRDVVRGLLREDSPLLSEQTVTYLRDCNDHVQHAAELTDALRDHAAQLLNLYLTLQGQRMNEIMKELTIIATIFIPLSFIASLYGMNFNPDVSRWNMPELNWVWGYPFALGLMTLYAVGLLFWFRRRGWFR